MVESDPVTARNVDLSNCDREQIQFPGATLAHGFLLVLKEPDWTVLQAGANAPEFLGGTLETVLGSPLDAWLEASLARSLRECAQRHSFDGPPVRAGAALLAGKSLDVFVHRSSGSLIVEFEVRAPEMPGRSGPHL